MLANAVVYGPAGMLILQSAAYWCGLALIATWAANSRFAQAVVVLAIGFFPPLFASLPMIWKDSGCLAFLLLCTGFALHASLRSSALLATLGLVAAFYGSALRTPNLLSVLPLLWLLCSALPGVARPAWRRLAATLLVAAVFAAGISLLDSVGVKRLPYRVAVPLWDLARMSVARDELLIPDFALRNHELDLPRLKEITKNDRDFPMHSTDFTYRTLSDQEANRLMEHWLTTIRSHPADYLRHRQEVTTLLFTDPRMKVWQLMESIEGFDLPFRFQERPGYHQVRRTLNRAAAKGFFAPWIYVALATGVLAASFAVRRATASEARAVALSALLYVAPLPVIAPSTDFRYSIWLVAGSLVSLVLLVSRAKPSEGAQAASA
jgi:hypothetical protein